MVAWGIPLRERSQNNYESKIILDQSAEFCNSLQSALCSQVWWKIVQILLQDFSLRLKGIWESKYISSKTRNNILDLLEGDDILKRLLSITSKLKGIITDENAEFINSLMLDNKFSAEKIISELKSFLENYENVLDVESDTIFPLWENLFAYKNSQWFYQIVYKNVQWKTVHFKNHPNFLKVPSKHSNNIFSGCTETGCYIFQVVPENVFWEEWDFIRIKHHFFENATHISELHFDEQTQENIFDMQLQKPIQKYKSTPQTHKSFIINSEFETKEFWDNSDEVTQIKSFNWVILFSDGEFLNIYNESINWIHSFYSLNGEKLFTHIWTLHQYSSSLIGIHNNQEEKIIEVINGNIHQLSNNPITFYYWPISYSGTIKDIFSLWSVFITINGRIGIYNTEKKKLQYFEIPKIKNVKKARINSNIIIDFSKQKYIFTRWELYKLKDEFIIRNSTIHERKWKYFSWKELLSFENWLAPDMNYLWSQEELDTYFDVVKRIDA